MRNINVENYVSLNGLSENFQAWKTVFQIAQKSSPEVIEERPVVYMNFRAEKCMQSVIKS